MKMQIYSLSNTKPKPSNHCLAQTKASALPLKPRLMLNYRKVGVFCELCKGALALNLNARDYTEAVCMMASRLNGSALRTPEVVVPAASPVIQSIY